MDPKEMEHAIVELQKKDIEREAVAAFKRKLITTVWEIVKAVLVPAVVAYFTCRAANGG